MCCMPAEHSIWQVVMVFSVTIVPLGALGGLPFGRFAPVVGGLAAALLAFVVMWLAAGGVPLGLAVVLLAYSLVCGLGLIALRAAKTVLKGHW